MRKKQPQHAPHPYPSIFRRRLSAILLSLILASAGVLFIWSSRAAVNPNLAGDLNGDNKVSVADLSILLSNFGKTGNTADMNGDAKVTVADLSILLTNFNKTYTPGGTPPPTPPTTPPPTPPTGNGTSARVKITFYGSYDNDPQGSLDIAHPVIHDTAGGTGTYADPLTYASPAGAGSYAWGQIIYVPSVQKYFIREDECAVSWTAPDGCGDIDMVDLYVGNPSSSQSVTDCEDSLTIDGDSEIILNPSATLTVDATPLWNQSTGTCGSLH